MSGLASEVGWWCVIASPLPLVAWTVAWLIMAKSSRRWQVTISAAVAVVSLSVIAFGIHGMVRSAHAQVPPTINGDCNAVGNGNITCPKIDLRPTPRHVDAGVAAQILKEVPKDTAKRVLRTADNAEACDMMQELYDFCKNNGYTLADQTIAVAMFMPPFHGTVFDPATSSFKVGTQ
jgi:hypothetical protein